MRCKKIISLLLGMLLIMLVLLMNGCAKETITVYDKDGKEFATLTSANLAKSKLEDKDYQAYLEIVLQEVISTVSQKEGYSMKEAEKQIFKQQLNIHTAFDQEAFNAMKEAYAQYRGEKLKYGCAMTDTQGHLSAVYSAGGNGVNYANSRTQPYSSFKPLSVYAPAMEKGLISWSDTYEDSPIKQIEDKDGTKRDWPANASNTYTYTPINIDVAIKKSYNTVAVKCLQEYGVTKSIEELMRNYNIPLEYEESRAHIVGEEEVLGNIALGYLYKGVTPIDMAGYYQIFASGGAYIEPQAVTKISDAIGSTIYETEYKAKQIINVETAHVMNQLLQGVVCRGGTGTKAAIQGVEVGGKTGTGDNGNWFVGFTPGYTCAVWHGPEINENCATTIFRDVVGKLDHDEQKVFPECKTIRMRAYCLESGKLATSKCKRIDKGYYTSINELEKCEQH